MNTHFRTLLLGLLAAFAPKSIADPSTFAGNPPWWASRGVIDANATPKDSAALNQGQLKKMATEAFAECSLKLSHFARPTGVSDPLKDLIDSWSTAANLDYAAITAGHVKQLAAQFYDRFAEIGLYPRTNPRTYPWSPGGELDYSMANAGQLKHLFRFFLPINPLTNTIEIDKDTGFLCHDGAFSINLPTIPDLGENPVITWRQGRGPGAERWKIALLSLVPDVDIGPSPGYALIAGGSPATAGICVAGKYEFGANIEFPNGGGVGLVTANIEVKHVPPSIEPVLPGDTGINYAFGAAISAATQPDENDDYFWIAKYDICNAVQVPAFSSCSAIPVPVEFRERTLPDQVHSFSMASNSSGMCAVYLRFTVPPKTRLLIAGPCCGTPNTEHPEDSTFLELATGSATDFAYGDVKCQNTAAAVTFYIKLVRVN
jgi:hypothetical protein